MQPYDFPRASLFVHLGADWIHFCVKLKRLTFAFCPVHIVAPEFICCCWSWSPLPLSLCMKQQSKIFPWQRIRQETPSPLLPSPPLPPQLSAQTLLPKREREGGGGERECVYFSASGLVAAPLWLDGELLLCGEAKKQKGRIEGSIITLIALIKSVLKGISMFTPF